MQLINFKWYYEFILSNNSNKIDKFLFNFEENQEKYIFELINEKIKLWNEIQKIFSIFWKEIKQIWFDSKTNRCKFYIPLYSKTFKESLKNIKKCKDILWIKKEYFLEKDFLKFDCIWFDISEKWIDLKIYELVINENNFEFLPEFINQKDIKEIWYLKNFDWRKKKFFRFLNLQEIEKFSDDFDISQLNILENNYNLQKKVKYFCIEGEKKELYFI